ncbi:hypothetical protein CD241_1930 [Corynebacterium diphtheriae 241]|nr:hypothetical protein CD241_1930 [Corynebacterium diphtheriae 241]
MGFDVSIHSLTWGKVWILNENQFQPEVEPSNTPVIANLWYLNLLRQFL